MKAKKGKKEETKLQSIKMPESLISATRIKIGNFEEAQKNYNEHIGTIGMALNVDPNKYVFNAEKMAYVPK